MPGVLALEPHDQVVGVAAVVSGDATHCIFGAGSRGTDVTDHKFRIGEQVELVPSLSERFAASSVYEVVRQLPTSNGELGYRIKSARRPCERVVRESQLRRS
jgi:hypothetical protein